MTETKEERRFVAFDEVRVETDNDTGMKRIVGYAAVFDKLSEDLGGFRERVSKSAFDRTLKEGADVRALIDHDPSKILGRNKAGTLKLNVESKGLKTTIDMPGNTYAEDLVRSIDRGDVDGMSFGFITQTDAWELQDGETVRTLKDVDLFDVSVVTYPAYPDTSVALRSKDKATDHEQAKNENADEDVKPALNWKGKNRLKKTEVDLRA
jgi:hypothetical protein